MYNIVMDTYGTYRQIDGLDMIHKTEKHIKTYI